MGNALFTVTAPTLALNLILVALIAQKRAWRWLPIFSHIQIAQLALFVLLLCAYYAPAVPDSLYHPLKVGVDLLCIPLEILYSYELLTFCCGYALFAVGGASMLHAIIKIEELIQAQYLPMQQVHQFRLDANIFLTLALIPCVYSYVRKEPIYAG